MAGYLTRRAQLLGPLGGSRGWTILWAAIMARRLLKRLASDKPEVLYNKALKPGEALVISNRDRPVRVIGAQPRR